MPSDQNNSGRPLPKISGRSIVRFLVASLWVGIVLAARDIDPRNILVSAQAALKNWLIWACRPLIGRSPIS